MKKDIVNFLMSEKGYVTFTSDTLIKHGVRGSKFVKDTPSWIQDKADSIVYNIIDNTVVIMDKYGRQLHEPVKIS